LHGGFPVCHGIIIVDALLSSLIDKRKNMKTKYKFIHFKADGDCHYMMTNKGDKFLGTIQWYEPWKEFCLIAYVGTIWSVQCLTDIIDFIEELEKE